MFCIISGLFQQAILISGSDQVIWAYNPTWLPPQNYTMEVANAMNCTYSTSAEMMACLRTKDAQDIANYREMPIVSINVCMLDIGNYGMN